MAVFVKGRAFLSRYGRYGDTQYRITNIHTISSYVIVSDDFELVWARSPAGACVKSATNSRSGFASRPA